MNRHWQNMLLIPVLILASAKMKRQDTDFSKFETVILRMIKDKEETAFPYFMHVTQSGAGYKQVFLCYWDTQLRLTFATQEYKDVQSAGTHYYVFNEGKLEGYYMESPGKKIISIKGKKALEHSGRTRILDEAETFLTGIEETFAETIRDKIAWAKRECSQTQDEIIICEDEWEAVPQNERLRVEISKSILNGSIQ